MPSCSIMHCGARKSKKHPTLTLHKFPTNEVMRRKWIEIIGIENINPRHKMWYVCSLHFNDSCLNKTLDVTRLRDGAVPLSLLLPGRAHSKNMLHLPTASSTSRTLTPQKVDKVVLREKQNILVSNLPLEVSLPSQNVNKSVAFAKEPDRTHSENLPGLPTTSTVSSSMIHQKIDKVVLSERQNIITSNLPLELPCEKNTDESVSSVKERQQRQIRKLSKRCTMLKRKVNSLKEKVRRRDGKIARFTDIIEDLRKRNFINNEECFILKECAGPEDFLKRQIAKSTGQPVQKKYSEELRKFSLTLHFYSPRAYEFIRNTYNTCLPHCRTLSKWYQHVDAQPGFTKEAFDVLRKTVEESTHPVICALTLDEMAIRKSLTWDPTLQKYYGRVDLGHDLSSDSVDEASQSLVLLLTAINGSWKLPIGYFFIISLTGEQKAILVQTAIQLCQDVGVKIVSLTCDGLAGNFSMFTSLGCNIQEQATNFVYHHNQVQIFIDPCHALKLIRNTFGDMRLFLDAMGREINFKYLEILLQIQEEKGLHLGTKIRKAHILFAKQIMKVKLATQLLSDSVADALEFCRDKLRLKSFQDCGGTINFIRIINNIFDVLNSHSIRPPGWKKAMCPENIGCIRVLFESAYNYIKALKFPTGELIVQSRRKTGFIGLMLDMQSALVLYEYLVDTTKMLKYIPLYKISQDHLELFFSSIRSRGGFNNNPNAIQFRAAYKKLLIRAEITERGVGNCIPLQQINILTCSSKNPVHSLNQLSERKDFVYIPEDDSDLYDTYINYVDNSNFDEYTQSVLEYIAGFVTRKLSRNIKCDTCVSLLIGNENPESLIFKKSRGGLQYASADVINIINKCEKLVKPELASQKKPENYYLYIFKFMSEYYENDNIFYLSLNLEHNINHRLLLIKSVIKIYIDLRFKYHGKKISDKVSHRSYFNKLILFRNE